MQRYKTGYGLFLKGQKCYLMISLSNFNTVDYMGVQHYDVITEKIGKTEKA